MDHVYANEAQIELRSAVCEREISSDHHPIISEFPTTKNIPRKETVSYRETKHADVHTFKEELKQVLANSFSDECNFENNYMAYCSAAESKLNEHYPVVTKTVVRKEKIKWIDDDFRKTHTQADRLS